MALLIGAAIVANPSRGFGPTGFADTPAWFHIEGRSGARMNGWLSASPGEFLIDVEGALLVGSTTELSVAPYNGAGIASTRSLVVTGGANFALSDHESAVVFTASVPRDVTEIHATSELEGGRDVLSTIATDAAGNRAAVVAIVRDRPYGNTDNVVVTLSARDSGGSSLATLFVRPFPLRDARCGNVTEIGTPTGGEPEESFAGHTPDNPATVIALRPACPSDTPR